MPEPSPEVTHLADRLHSAAIHLLRRVRRHDDAAGIGPARLSALSVLVFGGPCSLGELAAAEQVRAPTMSRTVVALEAEGLVGREPDPDDARVVRLRATPAGRDLLARARLERVRSLAADLARLDAGELAALTRALAALDRALSLPPRPPASG